MARKHGYEWIGKIFPKNTYRKTLWKCPRGHLCKATYADIRDGRNICPHCSGLINGKQISEPQRKIHKMFNGILNYPCGPYYIDIALPDKMIAIEYDCWFWHGHKQKDDAKRDAFLLTRGWKVLHVKSNGKIPRKKELNKAIVELENGEETIEIVLDDWGKTKTFAETQAQESIDPWEKGPIPISWDGGISFSEYKQLGLWE